MSALFGGVKNNAASSPTYTQMQLQSSVYGLAIPIVYGTTRIGWNLGDYVGFRQHQQSSSGGKGGVVGGGGKGGSSTSITYSASILGFLCEGPITGVYSSWVSQTQSAGTPGFTVFDGTIAQTPWTYLEDNYSTHALTYSGFAYIAGQDVDLGTSANLPNMNWEPQAIFAGSAPGAYGGNGCAVGGDADPSLVIPDLLTNAQYGLGFPANRVGQVLSEDEAHTIPSTGPYTVAVTLASKFLYNINATILSGSGLLTCVSGTPGPGQYAFNQSTGVYSFNAAQAGATVNIRYAALEALVDYQNFTIAAGLWVSPAYTDQTQASSMIDDLALATFSEVVWTSGVLTMVPRASAQVSGNGKTYTPPSEPLFSLTTDDFMENSSPIGSANSTYTEDAVLVTRSRVSDQINDIKIECFDRANQYAPTVVQATDQALIDRYGRRAAGSKSLHLFADVNAANTSAHLQLQDQHIRNNYSHQLDERYSLLDPMDLVDLTDPAYPNLTNVPARILEIQENDDGTLSYACEEYPGTIGVVPEFTLDAPSGTIQDFDVDPGDTSTPAIFDVPVQLAQAINLETWLAAHSATGNTNWGGCEVWLSSDDVDDHYTFAGKIWGASRMGTLTANLATGSDPDTTNTLSVDLTSSFGELIAGSTTNADLGDTICFVDGEYISYSAATLTATYKYNLGTYLRRGQWGSQISAHSSGSLFVRLDDHIFRMPYNATDKGRTIYVKLLSFNIFNGGQQSLADVSSHSHTIGGPPAIYAPSGLTVVPTLKGNFLTWTNAPDVGIAAIEIWRSSTSSFSGATHIADAGGYDTVFLDQNGTASNTQYWYWIRPRDISGNEGAYDPVTTGAGATGTTLQAQTADIANAAITAPKIASGVIPAILLAESIAAPAVVTSLPANDSATGPLVFNSTDYQLYRWNSTSSSWTLAVPAINITGTIVATQIASVNATAINGTLVNSQIGSGAVQAAQLAANAVTAPAIAANAVTASKIYVGSTVNLVMDAQCVDASYWSNYHNGTGAISGSAGGNTAWVTDHYITSAVSAADGGIYSRPTQCSPGDSFYGSAVIYTNYNGRYLYIMEFNQAGTNTQNTQLGGYTGSGGPNFVSGTVTTRNDTVSVSLLLYTPNAGDIAMGAPTLLKMYTGSLIVNGSIVGNNIAANTITGNNIAAQSISASKIVIGSTDNMILDGACADISYWGTNNLSGVQIATPGYNGPHWIGGTKTAGSQSVIYTQNIQVEPSSWYAINSYLYCQTVPSGGAFAIYSRTFDANGTYISDVAVVGNTTAGWQYLVGTFQTPANATTLELLFIYGPTTSGTCAVSAPFLRKMYTGSLIVDGTIVAANIQSGTITATQIASATILGTNIAANTLTANLFTANSVTAGTIAAGAINASAIIVSNIIVTGHIQANQVTNVAVNTFPGTTVPTSLTPVAYADYTTAGGDILVDYVDYVNRIGGSGASDIVCDICIAPYGTSGYGSAYSTTRVGGTGASQYMTLANRTTITGLAAGTYRFGILLQASTSSAWENNNPIISVTELIR